MDIVTRLKSFISYLGVQITQFADNCRIPRPTLSQLLNGRNKKVSDELIGKIHEAYPQLSVLWLMFGEGNMLHSQNIETSAPQNPRLFDFQETKGAVNDNITPHLDFQKDFIDENSTTVTSDKTDSPALESATIDLNPLPSSPDVTDITPSLSFSTTNPSKKIVNIIVYYNDNSFESFVPRS